MIDLLDGGRLEGIGRFWLAPMAGITDAPFRTIAHRRGAELVFTEMISAEALVRRNRNTLSMLEPSLDCGRWGVQLVGSDPKTVADAARMAEAKGASIIDINMGCPVPKVVAHKAGAALLREPQLVAEIVGSVRRAVSVPVSVKLRAGWRAPKVDAFEIARIAEAEGTDLIALHPRFADENYSTPARWELIAELKARLKVPVAGSGDVMSEAAAVRMIEETGCDVVLIARGALGDPWIFERARALLARGTSSPKPSPEERLRTFVEHLNLALEVWSEDVALHRMKKHLMWYSSGLAGSRRFRKMVSGCGDLKSLASMAERFFAEAKDGA
ncbi:MAG TPA: tRNA dihydrouridine synthase DusB [Proteobacteria bacterium]|nr:tRNA dihydrouridine synthase DusB [Pseudomonadota bacterium]